MSQYYIIVRNFNVCMVCAWIDGNFIYYLYCTTTYITKYDTSACLFTIDKFLLFDTSIFPERMYLHMFEREKNGSKVSLKWYIWSGKVFSQNSHYNLLGQRKSRNVSVFNDSVVHTVGILGIDPFTPEIFHRCFSFSEVSTKHIACHLSK